MKLTTTLYIFFSHSHMQSELLVAFTREMSTLLLGGGERIVKLLNKKTFKHEREEGGRERVLKPGDGRFKVIISL